MRNTGPSRRFFRLGQRQPPLDEAVDWEIEHHLAEQVDRLVEAGWDPGEARAEAERLFGHLGRHRDRILRIDRSEAAMRRRTQGLEGALAVVRTSLRAIRRQPRFALGVVVTLALGIGVNSVMFGVVDRLLLRPPEHVVDHGDLRRLFVRRSFLGTVHTQSIVTYPDLQDLRTAPEFKSVGGYTPARERTLGGGPNATRVRVALASHDFFPTLGVSAHRGRFFAPEEDRIGVQGAVVLGFDFWQSAFGGDPGILGNEIDLSGFRLPVIGIAPPKFTGAELSAVDAWMPLEAGRYLEAGSDRFMHTYGSWWLRAVARLAPGSTEEAATARATALHLHGRADRIERGMYDPEARMIAGPLILARGPEASSESDVARWLAGVSFVVLLIACANVANLFLARGARRRREVAVRLSLGVSGRRLVGESVFEAALLALAGGMAAVVLALWVGPLIHATLIPDLYWSPGLDGRLLTFTALISVGAGLLAGFGPAIQATRINLVDDLRDGGRGSTGRKSRTRGALSALQASLSVVLLVGAGLFVRSVSEAHDVNLGIDPDRVALVTLELDSPDADAETRLRVYEEAAARAGAMPAVSHVALTDVPFQWALGQALGAEGWDSIPALPGGGPYYYHVTPEYAATLGLSVIRGRDFEHSDQEGAPVAIVNATMERVLWPVDGALGKCLYLGESNQCTTIVGVMEDASRGGIEEELHMAYLLPLSRTDPPEIMGLYVRTRGDAAEALSPMAQTLRSFSPDIRWADVSTIRELIEPQVRSWQLGATLFTAFGGLALIVAGIGLYSLLAFNVAERTREIGIRSALGARRGRIVREVIAEGARFAVIGITVGFGVALMAAPAITDLLFQVEPMDPPVLLAVTVALLLASLLASITPALRATRVDPAAVMRTDA